MIIVLARIEVDPADIDRMRPLLDVMMRSTWEESGCLSYSLAVESEERGVISIAERWHDEAALHEHFKTPHMAAFNQAATALIKSMDAKIYDATNERPLVI